MKRLIVPMLALTLSAGAAAPALARVDWQAKPSMKTGQSPLDLAVSGDGKWTYVLSEDGKVEIYDNQGKLNDTIPVGPEFNSIAVDGRGGSLYLGSSKNKEIREISIDFIAEFNNDGSPFKGNSAAPVELVVFSDFQ